MTPDKPRRAAVIGWPATHSLSPRLHEFWLEKYGITGSYETLAIAPEHLQKTLKSLAAQGFCGVSVTLPHKEAALGIVDHADPRARKIGAVNTVIARGDGTLDGFNTDAFGFTENLLSIRFEPNDRPVVIFGAGGAARAAIVALQDMGAGEIRLVNRTQKRAEALAKEFGRGIRVLAWSDYRNALEGAALLVNTTSLGMEGQPPLEIALDALPHEAVVNDLVYVPLMTGLLEKARQRGNRVLDGLGMLLHQARPQFAAFFGREPEVNEELRRHVLEGR
jgi:shikimate dehydrogenase